jgi:hypothetical protein
VKWKRIERGVYRARLSRRPFVAADVTRSGRWWYADLVAGNERYEVGLCDTKREATGRARRAVRRLAARLARRAG